MALDALLYFLGKCAGVTGFVTLSFLIFSGDTARFWDKHFGLDRIIKFQRKFSYFTAVFILFHPLFFILSKGTLKTHLIPNFAYFPLALGISAFYIFLAVMVASYLYKRISYKVWQYIHILTYLLFFMTLYHGSFWGSDINLLKPMYLLFLTLIFIGIIYRTAYKIRELSRGDFIVKNIIEETPDTFTLRVLPPKKFIFNAGQFAFLRIPFSNLHARHPFTFSSSPEDRLLSFTIKEAGRFTKVAKNLHPESKIKVDGPFGKFVPPYDKDLVFIAGGVGIAPFMSIIEDRIGKNCNQNITLLYGSKTEEDIIFKRRLDAINKNWFRKFYILSQAPQTSYIKGNITKEIIEQYVPNRERALFFICGPKMMKDSLDVELKKLGISKKKIFTEDFFW